MKKETTGRKVQRIASYFFMVLGLAIVLFGPEYYDVAGMWLQGLAVGLAIDNWRRLLE